MNGGGIFNFPTPVQVEAGQGYPWQVSGHDPAGICNKVYADGSNGVYLSWRFVTYVQGTKANLFVRGPGSSSASRSPSTRST